MWYGLHCPWILKLLEMQPYVSDSLKGTLKGKDLTWTFYKNIILAASLIALSIKIS